jgi:hypothetical protein
LPHSPNARPNRAEPPKGRSRPQRAQGERRDSGRTAKSSAPRSKTWAPAGTTRGRAGIRTAGSMSRRSDDGRASARPDRSNRSSPTGRTSGVRWGDARARRPPLSRSSVREDRIERRQPSSSANRQPRQPRPSLGQRGADDRAPALDRRSPKPERGSFSRRSGTARPATEAVDSDRGRGSVAWQEGSERRHPTGARGQAERELPRRSSSPPRSRMLDRRSVKPERGKADRAREGRPDRGRLGPERGSGSAARRESSETRRPTGARGQAERELPRRSSSPPRSRMLDRRSARPERGTGDRGKEGRPDRGRVEPERGWGSVARRGAHQVRRPSSAAGPPARDLPRPSAPPPPPDEWVRIESPTRSAATTPSVVPRTGDHATQRQRAIPSEVAAEIRERSGLGSRGADALIGQAERASLSFEAHRFGDALRLAKSVLREAPNVTEMLAVAGLAAYRLARWQDGARQLEAYREHTGATDLVPQLMDCHRALGRTNKVAQLWTELRRSSADADVLAEARIVGAGTLADRGDLAGAISLLAAGNPPKSLRNPAERHLRRWYALADLYERAGDVPRAREFFGRVARVDPDAYDVRARLGGLGPAPRGRPRRTTKARVRRPTGAAAEEASD